MFLLRIYNRKRFRDRIETTFKDWSGNLEDLPDDVLGQIAEQLNAWVAFEEQVKQLGTPAAARPWMSNRSTNAKCSVVI